MRWWTSTERTIPSKPTLSVPDDLNVRYVPKIVYREVYNHDALGGGEHGALRFAIEGAFELVQQRHERFRRQRFRQCGETGDIAEQDAEHALLAAEPEPPDVPAVGALDVEQPAPAAVEALATRLGHLWALSVLHEPARCSRQLMASPDLREYEASARRHLAVAARTRILEADEAPEQMAVGFADLEGFTSLYERLPAPQLAEFLNRHFALLGGCIDGQCTIEAVRPTDAAMMGIGICMAILHDLGPAARGAIGQAPGLLHQVGDEDDRDVATQLLEHVLDAHRGHRVDGDGELVEAEDLRLMGQRACDGQPLLLPAGESRAQAAEPVLDLVPQGRLPQAAFGGAIPSLPGAVGTFEGAFGGALTLLSGDESTSFAVAITARLYNYLNSGVIGGIGLAREGETLSGIYHQLMNLRTKENRIS